MKAPASLTTVFVALFSVATITAQTGRTTTPDTEAASASTTQTAKPQSAAGSRTREQAERDEAAEERFIRNRELKRMGLPPEPDAEANATPTPIASPSTKLKTWEETQRDLEESQRRADAEQQKFLEQMNREANRLVPQVKLPPIIDDAPYYKGQQTYPTYQEQQRLEYERAQREGQQQKEATDRAETILRSITTFGLSLFVLFAALVALGVWKFPTSRAFRVPAKHFITGAIGVASCWLAMKVIGTGMLYWGAVSPFGSTHELPIIENPGVYVIGVLIFIASLVFICLLFVGAVGTITSFCTLSKNKTMRLVTVLGVSAAGIIASGTVASHDWAGNGNGQSSVPAVIGISTFLTVLGVGLVKVKRGSGSVSARSSDSSTDGKEDYHGTARFAEADEIDKLTAKRGELPAPGSFVLAPPDPHTKRKNQIILPREEAVKHLLILGGSGTGKSRGYFLPNCAQAANTSIVVTDPKSELWNLTSGYQESALRFAPTEADASEGFNWIPLCTNARIAELAARAIMEAGNTSNTDQFWIDAESAYLAAIFAHAATMDEPTPLTAYRLFTRQHPDTLLKQLLESPSDVAREQAIVFLQTDPRIKGAIVPAVSARLQFLRDPNIQRFTSATIEPPDFGRLRRNPTAIYWCLREQDIVRLRPLTSLFFAVLLEQLASESVPEGKGVPVTLMLDEFANIGKIPEFATTISLARGRGVSICLGIQSLSQLDAAYGRDNAQTIISNCATKIALHGLDYQTAKSISDSLGETTIVAKRHSFNFSLSGIGIGRYGSEHRRPLMTPDEVMRLSEYEALIRTGNKYPMKLNKGYYDHPANTARTNKLGEARSAYFPPAIELMTQQTTAPAQTVVAPDAI